MTEDQQEQTTEKRAASPEFLTKTSFEDFDLPDALSRGLQDAGFQFCTPIQAQTLPLALDGRDVAGQAQTGTGKTGAFLVTVIASLLRDESDSEGLPTALIMAPTRELSHQIVEEAQALARHSDLRILEVVGGVDYQRQANGLKAGVDIVIGTPGRLIDYYKQRIFKTTKIKQLVIDEADRLLDLGFEKDMRYILRNLPRYDQRQSMLFSATLSHRVLELTYEYMNLPEFISITPETVTTENVDQSLYHVGKGKKLELLLGLFEHEEWSRVLIFVNTKAGVDWLTQKLQGNQLPAERITGDLPQRKRFRLMEQYKQGKIKILVATDVASRGIHVEDISHVINYDIPQDPENYVHRIGRTARAGKTGRALTLACEDYVYHLQPLEQMLGYKIPVVWPGDDWYIEDQAKPIPRGRAAGSKRGPKQRSAGRGRRPSGPPGVRKPSGARKPAKKARRNHYPGEFFGFAPPKKKARPQKPAKAEKGEPADPQAKNGTKSDADSGPPKKRRRRRRKKPAPKKATGSKSTTGKTASGADKKGSGKPKPRSPKPE
ncbi:MAG: DEAD/DEAH box helicase [Desulfobacterales bacterium]|jgi:ATP-dependent RNA helicase RhlB